ncbi:hypothetical protein B0H16DRAFT_1435632 [Mycena metata]|uniref:MYND-type domain-containing protein n=1 Tax=Mycena metata TaxID=1033252 RepID=A0AAD7H789_9AGAR|nr:hypothetical protein B0H16DRAFT_1435632 [Mycena metata]
MPPMSIPAELLASLKDDNFWRSLEAITKKAEKVMPELTAASHKRGDSGTLDQRIEDRSEFARMGMKLAAITGSALLDPGCVPRQQLPVPNGMTHCVDLVNKIVRKDYGRPGQRAELAKLPYLLKRIRHLLRVFYNFKVGQRIHPDMVFCDWRQTFDVGLTLHQVGLCLQLDPPRLRAVMEAGGRELEVFLLDEEMDVGDFRKAAMLVEQRVAADVEADASEHVAATNIEQAAGKDLAAHVMAWFYGDVSVAFILNEGADSTPDEKRWAQKAMKRLVRWSTSATLRGSLGDSLTDTMRPIYWSTAVLTRFCQAGGLAALFGDWVNSSCRDLCEDALKELPDTAWEKQTSASLAAITRELQAKLNQETDEIADTPIFIDACFSMYTHYGLAPLQKAGRRESPQDPVVFYYLAHHLKRLPPPANTAPQRADFARLLANYTAMPLSMRKRYGWANLTIAGRWDSLDSYGCEAEGCPEQAVLEQLRARRVRGVREPAVERRLEEWGSKAMACKACGRVAYCSAACQRNHWPTHKPECLEHRKANRRV